MRIGILLFSFCFFGLTSRAQDLTQLKNYVAATKDIHTCGWINENDLITLKSAGINTIIGLLDESPNEVALLKKQAEKRDMAFILIPVSWEKPTLESLELFFEVMDRHKNTQLLVHCQLNWRASAYVYLYRTIRLKEDETTARKAILAIWNPDRNRTWSRFIIQAREHLRSNHD